MAKYRINQLVTNIVELQDEQAHIIPVNSTLRIVAIAPKVMMIKKDLYHDNLPYFFNAVILSQQDDYSNRIRANFCTIKEIK